MSPQVFYYSNRKTIQVHISFILTCANIKQEDCVQEGLGNLLSVELGLALEAALINEVSLLQQGVCTTGTRCRWEVK